MFELTEIMRQREFLEFAEALNRLRVGDQTAADIALFQTRVVDPLHLPAQYSAFDRHIFATHKKRDNHNSLILRLIGGPECTLPARDEALSYNLPSRERKHFLSRAREKDDTETATLVTTLALKVGLLVEITCNVDIPDQWFVQRSDRLCTLLS